MGKTIKNTLKDKKKAVKARMAARKAAMKAKFKGAVACASMALLVALTGCALERADPAARSNRATYTLSVVAREGSTVTAYVADGLMATADGEGAITQPSTLTTTQSPEISVPGDALSAGIQAAAHLGGKLIDAKSAQSAAASTPVGADGLCSEPGAGCADGACKE